MNINNTSITNNRWQFWIDRGGTFTDIVAKAPDGEIIIHKLLSENPERYPDAPVQGIREILGISENEPIPSAEIEVIKMGTTVATNALLERKGDRTVLVINKGFKDALRIGYQNRPNIFAREIILPEMLYEKVIEVECRYTVKGEETIPLQTTELIYQLETVYKEGIRSCAIVLMHGYRYPKHEQKIKEISEEIGFTQISVSHEVSPLMKLVSRGDTTVVDAYLSPILRRYVNQVSSYLESSENCGKENRIFQENYSLEKGKIDVELEDEKEPEKDFNFNLAKESLSSKDGSEINKFQQTPDLEIGKIDVELGDEKKPEKRLDLKLKKQSLNSSKFSKPNPVKLMFMQSNGGLTDAQKFQGKDSILSGPAGGIVGAVQTSRMAGFHKIISFDMGGTSTDVAHYAGAGNKTIEYEREFETEIAGVRLRTPMMSIHTVAAGGGSILFFDGARYRVGPESAGANPGPAAYGKGGPLTITDCNLMVGKIQPEFFPKVFGNEGNLPLNFQVVREKFIQLAAEIGNGKKPEEVASGYLAIAVEKMANAIKKISLQKGYDVSEYTLCCFGGAGGQHACLIADALGMKQIFIHPYAGVLSAYGMGLADIRVMKEKAVEKMLSSELLSELKGIFAKLEIEAKQELISENYSSENSNLESTTDLISERNNFNKQDACVTSLLLKVHLKYQGSDSTLIVDFSENISAIKAEFETAHRQRYGFIMAEKSLIVEAVSLEVIQQMETPEEIEKSPTRKSPTTPVTTTQVYTAGKWHNTPIYLRENLQVGDKINSPALIIEKTGTNIIEPGWEAELTAKNHLILTKIKTTDSSVEIISKSEDKIPASADPVMLEIFNNLFRAIAEQMGITLQNTSSSVNIKERLDFSCAIFDKDGELVANAPHIPIHLGSMSESVNALISEKGNILKPGDVYVLNNPYNGGTHLPDITVITPVFLSLEKSKDSYFIVQQDLEKKNNNDDIVPETNSPEENLDKNLTLENQTNICLKNFPENNSSSESLSEKNLGLGNKSITENFPLAKLPINQNLTLENQTNISPTSPENTEEKIPTPIFYVASRGHHADIGGITPGSMPPHSKTVEEEGILIDNFQLVKNGKFQEKEILKILTSGKYPARNTNQNIADLQAQVAANEKGVQELQKMTENYGLQTVQTYMKFVQNNAENSVRKAINKLSSSLTNKTATCILDDGNKISISVSIDPKNLTAKIDFTDTSPQLPNNFNAPKAVCKAAVLYVFRTLVDDDIPLNAGCLKPLEIIIPQNSMLNPKYPAAVVAGNVETSQAIADTLYNALGIMASSQGTMNNFTFGNSKYQYYETICGGSGAGMNFNGTDAVHTHMTNSRLTDPEVLEFRFPILLESFTIRYGSGGEGLYKGGDGVIRRMRFLEEMTAGILSGRRFVSPPGLNGGGDGLVGKNYVERNDGKVEELGGIATVEMNVGDVFVIETPGGGGFQVKSQKSKVKS
ncbi:hydantoinase B/oxoprolinase family protein [Okeania sp.]|uniref:hydantoinase B/oxoprolinase family protein n=1 Tax=Okeania sp. TaxID=3100323 RepID=UPI002B4B9407|nr:hydantoinase B/oxoprolinase family protein [Okeania sp.]MEB3340519.1 hydantoinase B/oxoprolinase family protein [Okeania sp.]